MSAAQFGTLFDHAIRTPYYHKSLSFPEFVDFLGGFALTRYAAGVDDLEDLAHGEDAARTQCADLAECLGANDAGRDGRAVWPVWLKSGHMVLQERRGYMARLLTRVCDGIAVQQKGALVASRRALEEQRKKEEEQRRKKEEAEESEAEEEEGFCFI